MLYTSPRLGKITANGSNDGADVVNLIHRRAYLFERLDGERGVRILSRRRGCIVQTQTVHTVLQRGQPIRW